MSQREAEDNEIQEPIEALPEELFCSVNEFTSLDGMQTFIGMQADKITGYERQFQEIQKAVYAEELSAQEKVDLVKAALKKNGKDKTSVSHLVLEQEKETLLQLLRRKSEETAVLQETIDKMKTKVDLLTNQLSAKSIMQIEANEKLEELRQFLSSEQATFTEEKNRLTKLIQTTQDELKNNIEQNIKVFEKNKLLQEQSNALIEQLSTQKDQAELIRIDLQKRLLIAENKQIEALTNLREAESKLIETEEILHNVEQRMQEHLEKDKDKENKLADLLKDETTEKNRLELTDQRLKRTENELQVAFIKLKNLEEQLSTAKVYSGLIQKQLTEYQQKCKHYEEQLALSELKLKASFEKYKQNEIHANVSLQKIQILQERLKNTDDKLKAIVDKLTKTEEDMKKVEIKFKKADKKKKEAEEQLKKTNEEYKRKTDQLRKQSDDLFKKIDEQNKKMNQLNKQLEKRLEMAFSENREISTKLDEIAQMLDQSRISCKDAQEARKKVQIELNQSNLKIKKMEQSRTESVQLRDLEKMLKQSREERKKSNEEYQISQNKLLNQISSLRGDLRIRDKSVYEAEQLLLNARNQIKVLEQENERLKIHKNRQLELISTFKKSEQSLKLEFQKKEEKLLSNLRDKNAELQQYIERGKPLDEKNFDEKYIKELSQKDKSINTLTEDKARLTEYNTQFRDKVNLMKKEISTLQDKNKLEEKSKRQLIDTCDQLRAALNEYQSSQNLMPKGKLFELIGRFLKRLSKDQKLELKREIGMFIV